MDSEPTTQTIIDGVDTINVVELETAPPPEDQFLPVLPAAPVAGSGFLYGRSILVALGVMAFLYFARPVVLPLFLAMIIATTLKPVVCWFCDRGLPRGFVSAIVLCAMIAAVGAGFFQLGQPAVNWMNQAPQHMADLRQRVQMIAPHIRLVNQAAQAVTNFGETEDEKLADQKQIPTVEVKDGHSTTVIVGWTGTFLIGLIETLVLTYLLLAAGDQFLRKLVHVMPTLSDKKRAVEISREIQQNVATYLFSVSLINIGLGLAVSGGLFFMGVPNPLMWGVFAAVMNFIPYFGPFVGVLLLGVVGLLSFDSLWQGIMPPAWYLLLHLMESNFVSPILLSRRFTLNAVVIFVSLIFWTWLWGVPGAVLSVPILVSIKAICDRFPGLSPISELLTNGSKA